MDSTNDGLMYQRVRKSNLGDLAESNNPRQGKKFFLQKFNLKKAVIDNQSFANL
jgi:hypothetical protein